jgi:hypothetical protein
MTHIAFITLFLGLTLGPQPVAVKVTGPAHHVEILIDGRLAAVMGQDPWRATVDLGSHLLPHRIVARAVDADGREVARAEQTVNMPRSPAEVQIVLDRDAAGVPSSAQVLWQSLEADRPREVTLTLDGTPLVMDERFRAAIPDTDVSRPHLLQARTVSPQGLVVTTEVAFGGGLETTSGRQLTAVPVRLLDTKTSPGTADLERWLRVGGEAATVVAIEELPADVIIVRHPYSIEASARLDNGRQLRNLRSVEVPDKSVLHHPRPLARFVWPVPNRTASTVPTDLMPYTNGYEFSSATTLRAIVVNVNGTNTATHLRYADAVAVAGLRAMSIRRPRAVVLLMGSDARDESRLQPAQAREYLRAVGVPLFVWALSGMDGLDEWGKVVNVGNRGLFDHAFADLHESLRSQRIVWVDGDHLPGEIEVSDEGRNAIEVLSSK